MVLICCSSLVKFTTDDRGLGQKKVGLLLGREDDVKWTIKNRM
jgi:hypothetical protein